MFQLHKEIKVYDNKKMGKFSKEYNIRILIRIINVSMIYKMIYKRTFFFYVRLDISGATFY